MLPTKATFRIVSLLFGVNSPSFSNLSRFLTLSYLSLCLFYLGCEKESSNVEEISDLHTGGQNLAKLNDHYVGASVCAECHQEAHAKWEDSHHYHAMELPSRQTVRADFNNSTFTHHGKVSRFHMIGDKYFVDTENQKGEIETFEVAYTFGWEPLQQYLVKFPDGRLQVLPTCWDVEKQEWYHLYGEERIAPEDPLFWTRPLQNWDHMCADCHSTNLHKEFDFSSQKFSVY